MLQSSFTNKKISLPLNGIEYEKLLKGLVEHSTFKKETRDSVEQDMTRSF